MWTLLIVTWLTALSSSVKSLSVNEGFLTSTIIPKDDDGLDQLTTAEDVGPDKNPKELHSNSSVNILTNPALTGNLASTSSSANNYGTDDVAVLLEGLPGVDVRVSSTTPERSNHNQTPNKERKEKTDLTNFVPDSPILNEVGVFSKTLVALLSSLNLVEPALPPPVFEPAQSKQNVFKGITIPTDAVGHPGTAFPPPIIEQAQSKQNVKGITIPTVTAGQPVTITKGITIPTVTVGQPVTITKGGSVSFAEGLAAFLALLAAIGAGIAALIAFVIKPLQIANQILAIIAIALFIAYFIEDKHYIPKGYFKEEEYEDYDSYNLDGIYLNTAHTSGYGSSYSEPYKQASEGYPQANKGYSKSDNKNVMSNKEYSDAHKRNSSPHKGSSKSNKRYSAPDKGYSKGYQRHVTSTLFHSSTEKTFRRATNEDAPHTLPAPAAPVLRQEIEQQADHDPSMKISTHFYSGSVPDDAEVNPYAAVNPFGSTAQSRQGASGMNAGASSHVTGEIPGKVVDTTVASTSTSEGTETTKMVAEKTVKNFVDDTWNPNITFRPRALQVDPVYNLGRPRSDLPLPALLGVAGRVTRAVSKFSALYDH